LASIDAFCELAESAPPSRPTIRLSLLRLASKGRSAIDAGEVRQRRLILFAIAALHVLFLLALWAAMRPQPMARIARDIPMQITIIERHVPVIVPKLIADAVPRVRPAAVALPSPAIAKHSQALQVVAIVRQPPSKQAAIVQRPLAYDPNAAAAAPHFAPPPAQARNLLAHRSVSFMLPGGARPNSVDFHVRDGASPQKFVNKWGGVISGMIANSSHMHVDPNGMVTVAADRGLRTSGRDSDPCEDIALDTMDLDPDDTNTRDQADRREQDSCEGH
jgi:hypothetical protein